VSQLVSGLIPISHDHELLHILQCMIIWSFTSRRHASSVASSS